MEHTFDHTWTTGDCEAVFRITYTAENDYVDQYDIQCMKIDLVDVDCIAIKLQDEDGKVWHEQKVKDRWDWYAAGSLAMDAEDRFKKSECKRLTKLNAFDFGGVDIEVEFTGEEAIEALCLAEYESE